MHGERQRSRKNEFAVIRVRLSTLTRYQARPYRPRLKLDRSARLPRRRGDATTSAPPIPPRQRVGDTPENTDRPASGSSRCAGTSRRAASVAPRSSVAAAVRPRVPRAPGGVTNSTSSINGRSRNPPSVVEDVAADEEPLVAVRQAKALHAPRRQPFDHARLPRWIVQRKSKPSANDVVVERGDRRQPSGGQRRIRVEEEQPFAGRRRGAGVHLARPARRRFCEGTRAPCAATIGSRRGSAAAVDHDDLDARACRQGSE